MATRYIETDNRRLSWSECWNLGPGIGWIILFGAKMFRIRMPLGSGIPLPDSVREFEIAESELLPEVRNELAATLNELQSLGFHSPQFQIPKNSLLRGVYVVSVALLHSSGEQLAQFAYSKTTLIQPPKVKIQGSIQTLFKDGTRLVTSGGRRQFDPLPGVKTQYLPNAPVARVYEAHQRRLEKGRCREGIRKVLDLEELWQWLDEEAHQLVEERLRRGAWVIMADEQVEQLKAKHSGPPPLPSDVDTPVFAALEGLQQPRKSWGPAAMIFAVSLVLFLVIGSLQWKWEFVVMIVPILFFHELGHYLAMRWFGYKNLRMFFIPLFGAAVSGLRLHAPAWKQVIVSLAGPVPGIIVGAALEWVGTRTGNHLLQRFARLCLIVNGFNLLPFLPLDGGRVLDALFYVRNRWLEVVAVIVAAVGMMALSHLGSGKVLFYVGLAMLFSLPQVWRLARITSSVRAKGFKLDEEDTPSISREAASAILTETRAVMPAKRPMHAKALAQIVMSVYQRLHTRPAGWLASLGLLGLYGGAFVLAIGAALHPLWDRLQTARMLAELNKPVETKLAFACAAESMAGSAETDSGPILVAASFGNAAQAREAFDRLQTNSISGATLFGQTVFAFAGDERAAARGFSGAAARLLTGDAASNHIVVHIRATLGSAELAKEIDGNLREYFHLSQEFRILPPWADHSQISAEEIARQTKARHTYGELQRIPEHAWGEPGSDIEKSGHELSEAFLHHDTNTIRVLTEQRFAAVEKRTRELEEQLLTTTDPGIDHSTVELYLKRGPRDFTNAAVHSAWVEEMGGHLGAQNISPLGATGMIQQSGREVTLSYLEFARLDRGLLALAHYFCDHGCTNISYGLEAASKDEE